MKYLFVFIFALNIMLTAQVRWVCSTGGEPWREKSVAIEPFNNTQHRLITIAATTEFQTIDGFGGCFNERGWDALSYLSEQDRRAVLDALFDATDGCKFTICRMPVGANDYSMDYYSLNDTPNDYDMKKFSMEREHKYLIPYIKAAMQVQPEIKIFASPWCPPAWMKINGHYACQGQMDESRMRWEPQVLEAYALYFSKFVQAYHNEGINVYSIHIQNEVDACQIFPSCLWSGEELAEFFRDYMIPRFDKDGLDTELWLGTVNHGDIRKYADIVWGDPLLRQRIVGVGYQWDGKHAAAETRRKYPDRKIMQTENECGDGSNDIDAGLYTFGLLKKYFDAGTNSYIYWNMVLDESGMSTWGWKQNSMISINRYTRKPQYNFEFYVMKHFSHFVQPGAVRIQINGETNNAVAFKNPDGSIVVNVKNDSFNPQLVTFKLGNTMAQVTVPNAAVGSLIFE